MKLSKDHWLVTAMPKMPRIAARFAAVAVAVIAFGALATAETNKVRFPADLDKLTHYTTVKRGEVTEHILASPAAIEAVKSGNPIPNGSHFVLVDYRNGQVHRYFVMEKGEGFGADYDARRRTADWQFQWFWPDKSINLSENTQRCQSCHSSQERSDYLFTGSRIPRFSGKPIE